LPSHDELPLDNLQSSDEKVAQTAHKQILNVGQSVVPQLLPVLSDESKSVVYRSRVAKLLGELKSAEALQPIIDCTLSIGKNLDTGRGMFSGLGGFRVTIVNDSAKPPTRQSLDTSGTAPQPNSRPIKANFIGALGNYKESQAIEALATVIRDGDFDSQIFAL